MLGLVVHGLAMPVLPILICLLLVSLPGLVRATTANLCGGPIAAIERISGVPDRLMQAIAVMESGRRDPDGSSAPWPWTINVEGVGEVYETKQAAIAAVQGHQARGARSIDVGCMQVNLMHHAEAFASLEEAFDPAANARYAARFLQQLLAQTGSWPLAVAGYHSLTPEIGGDYAKKVLAIWARPELGRSSRAPASTAWAAGVGAAQPPSPFGMAAAATPTPRLLASPRGALPTLVGRGLDSYRAMPTRLAAAFGRS